MTKTKIDKKRLVNKVLEDGIKKGVELAVVGAILGFSFNAMLLTVAGVLGGSLYLENCQINNLGGKVK